MAPEQLAEAERLLLAGSSREAVCEALGVSVRSLERAWRAAHGTTPVRWAREQGAHEPAGSSPPVFFRYPRHADLVAVAEADGMEPNAWAREALDRAVTRALERRRP